MRAWTGVEFYKLHIEVANMEYYRILAVVFHVGQTETDRQRDRQKK